jgi:hypothetical protein
MATPVPSSNPGPDMGVPVVRLAGPVRRRVEHDVVRHVPDRLGQPGQAAADGLADGQQVRSRALVQVGEVLAGNDQHFVGHGTPERADHHDALVGVDDPLPRVLLRLDGGAQEARPDEAGEARLLLGQLTRDERHAEQLAVRVLQGRAGLASRVHDGLGVAEVGSLGVLLEAIAQRRHHQARLLLAQHPPRGVVLGGEDEDLVDAPGGGLGEHGTAVGHDEGLVSLEGRVQVGHHPHQPVP